MTDLLEEELRALFSADAENAPLPRALAQAAIHRVRRRRRTTAAFAGSSLAVVAAVIAASGAVGGGHSPRHHIANPDEPARHGALPNSGLADCIAYDPSGVAERAFAFDGTVMAIGPRITKGDYALSVVSVTFKVHEWFHGGEGSPATVTMTAPEYSAVGLEELVPSYAVGTRLLVSGQPAEGGEPYAGSCGFTRYYDPETAAEWRAASHQAPEG